MLNAGNVGTLDTVLNIGAWHASKRIAKARIGLVALACMSLSAVFSRAAPSARHSLSARHKLSPRYAGARCLPTLRNAVLRRSYSQHQNPLQQTSSGTRDKSTVGVRDSLLCSANIIWGLTFRTGIYARRGSSVCCDRCRSVFLLPARKGEAARTAACGFPLICPTSMLLTHVILLRKRAGRPGDRQTPGRRPIHTDDA